ncbi:MAG: thermonuclease family protein [Candidatus Aenigmatarchaeota archaeon]
MKGNVTEVIDGDTVVIEDSGKVRLMGVDSTEVGNECYEEAKEWLTEKVNGTEVKVETVGEGTYGRNLSYIFKEERNINKKLVREGLAYTHYFDPGEKYIDKMIEAERRAIENNRGCLWNKNMTASNSVHPCEAEKYVSEVEIVQGEVSEVNRGDGITYLNFGGKYPDNCFAAIIWDDYQGRFSRRLESYENKTVRTEGLITTYKNQPRIQLRDTGQIKVV